MDDRLGADAILDYLGALSQWLRVRAPEERHCLYVVGGAALALCGFTRTTYDVDLLRPTQLSSSLRQGAAAVARARHLAPSWLETGPAEIFRRLGRPKIFPAYFPEAARTISMGESLVVEVASRQALLSLKLLAASPSARKHLDDIHVMAPGRDEILEALRFVLDVDNSPPRHEELQEVLELLGQGNLLHAVQP